MGGSTIKHITLWTSGMLHVVGEWESMHAKLEVCTTPVTYMRRLGKLAPLANYMCAL